MSLATFKRKSVTLYGSNQSGKPPGGWWFPRGPFGPETTTNSTMLESVRYMINNKLVGPVGFSINGPFRNVGAVGQNMKFSQNGTPFRGIYARGHGGNGGRYYQGSPTLNACVGALDTQSVTYGLNSSYAGVKPSVLSTRGMLRTKYKWAYNGQYPNYWVQPNYGTSNLSDNTSQGVYIHTKSAGSDCVVDTNDFNKYKAYKKNCGPFNCQSTPARGYKFNLQQSNAPYTKGLYVPQTSGQHTLRIQRRCADPLPAQRPFPYATNGDNCNSQSTRLSPPSLQ